MRISISAKLISAAALLIFMAAFSSESLAEEVESGLCVGEFAGPFKVMDSTGPAAGKTLCYYCRYGQRPVVAIFVDEMNDHVAALIKEIDSAVEKNRSQRMAAFVVYLAEDPFTADKQLKDFAEKHSIQRTPLTIFRDSQQVLQSEYKITGKAKITVMMWVGGKVEVNHAFAGEQLDNKAIETIVKDTAKILN